MYIFMFIFIYTCIADALKIFKLKNFKRFFQFTFKIQEIASKLLPRSGIFFQITSKIRHFLPSYFQDQAFSSKLLPRSGIFFQVTSKIKHFLSRYFQDQAFSFKLLPRFTHFLQDLARSDIFIQDLPRYLQE